MPTLSLGPVDLSTYQVLYGAGLLVAGLMSLRRLVSGGLPDRIALRLWIFTIWGGLAGSWLLHQVVVQVHALAALGRPAPLTGGTTVLGGLIGCTALALWLCRRWRLTTGRVFDLGVVPVPLGQAIGRLGCLAAGCCAGRPTDSWLGVRLPDAHGAWAVRYPTQLLSSVADLAIFVTLIVVERGIARRPRSLQELPPGLLFLLFVMLTCGKRFVIELLRVTRPPVVGPLTWAQVVTAAGLLTAALLAGSLLRRR